MEIKILNDSSAQFIIDGNIYSLEVIHKCFYWYGGKHTVEIKTKADFFVVEITEQKTSGTC